MKRCPSVALLLTVLSVLSASIEAQDLLSTHPLVVPRHSRLNVAADSDAWQYRLPTNVDVVSYETSIDLYYPVDGAEIPEGRNMTFDGSITITIIMKNTTDTVTLNTRNLVLINSDILDSNDTSIGVATITYNKESEQLHITSTSPLQKNDTYKLVMSYNGTINRVQDGGLFFNTMVDNNGNTKFFIATQMKAFNARSVFPCFDEPEYKAPWTISLTYPKSATSLMALSNAAATNETSNDPTRDKTVFEQTVAISPHNVAFAVGLFDRVLLSSVTDKIYVSVYGWPGTKGQLSFAANQAQSALQFLLKELSIKYPMKKYDLIALPDFPYENAGNLGLSIMDYKYVIENQKTFTTRDVSNAALKIHQTVAQQFFGGLTTAAWWDDAFMDDGLSRYFGYGSMQNALKDQSPRYFDSQMVFNELLASLEVDGDINTKPIIAKSKVSLDEFSGHKSAALFRSLIDVTTHAQFMVGIQAYLKKYEYQAATRHQLFAELTAHLHNIYDWCFEEIKVENFFNPYLVQSNFAVLQVSAYSTFEMVNQNSFINKTLLPMTSAYNYNWPVPLRYITYTNNSDLFWVEQGPDTVPCFFGADKLPKELHPETSVHASPSAKHAKAVHHPPHHQEQQPPQDLTFKERIMATMPKNHPKQRKVDHYTIFGTTSSSYARIEYDLLGFERMLFELEANSWKVPNVVKVSMVSDEFALLRKADAYSEQFSFGRILDLMQVVFRNEIFGYQPSYALFQAAQPAIEFIANVFRDTMDAPFEKMLYWDLFKDVFRTFDWGKYTSWELSQLFGDLLIPFVRNNINNMANQALHEYELVRHFCGFSTNGTAYCDPVTTDYRRAVFCAAAKFDNASNFGELQRYAAGEIQYNPYFFQEYYAILQGMTCAENEPHIKYMIRYFLSSPLSPSMVFGWFKQNPKASDVLLQYMTDKPHDVANYVGFTDYMDAMTYNWRTYDRQQQFTQLMMTVDKYLTANQTHIMIQYENKIQAQITWFNNFAPQLSMWMYDNLVPINKELWGNRTDGNIEPVAYDLQLQPYIPGKAPYPWFKNMTFEAKSQISALIRNSPKMLAIHSHRMLIDPYSISVVPISVIQPSIYDDWVLNKRLIYKDYDNAMLYIPLRDNITVDEYVIKFTYTGFIFNLPFDGVNANVGRYEFNGKSAAIFYTDHGKTGTRSLLPCIDDPMYKAFFNLKITHHAEMVPLSNAVVRKVDREAHWTTTTFETTINLPTYMFSIAVGHFAHMSTQSNNGIVVRVVSWTGMEQYGEFALKVATDTIDYMTSTFAINIDFDKIDYLALPLFSIDAPMAENFGLIMGKYENILLDPRYARISDYAQVSEMVAHNTIHQWFGALVTLDWWNDLFLNEGFAEYWFALALNYSLPDQADYVLNYNFYKIAQEALTVDCTTDAKPLIDNKTMFNIEPYYKGNMALQMLSLVLGPDVLKEGIRNYINDHIYNTVTPAMLWSELDAVARKYNILDWNNSTLSVTKWMTKWSNELSYPRLIMSVSGNKTTMQQQSCLPASSLRQWDTPMTVQDPSGSSLHWFTGQMGHDEIFNSPTNSLFRIYNTGTTSMVRVVYDNSSFQHIVNYLDVNHRKIDQSTKAMLISDTLALVNDYYEYDYTWDRFLDLTKFLRTEYQPLPWHAFLDAFDILIPYFRFQPGYDELVRYFNYIAQTWEFDEVYFRAYGIWADDSLMVRLTELACRFNNSECIDFADYFYNNFAKYCVEYQAGTAICQPDYIPDYHRTVYCYGAEKYPQTAAEPLGLFYWHYTQQDSFFNRDADDLMYGLSCSPTNDKVEILKLLVLEGFYSEKMIFYLAENDPTGMVLFNFFTTNLGDVLDSAVDYRVYVKAMTTNWSTKDQLNKMYDFSYENDFKKLNNIEEELYFDQYNLVAKRLDYYDAYGKQIVHWIKKNVP